MNVSPEKGNAVYIDNSIVSDKAREIARDVYLASEAEGVSYEIGYDLCEVSIRRGRRSISCAVGDDDGVVTACIYLYSCGDRHIDYLTDTIVSPNPADLARMFDGYAAELDAED